MHLIYIGMIAMGWSQTKTNVGRVSLRMVNIGASVVRLAKGGSFSYTLSYIRSIYLKLAHVDPRSFILTKCGATCHSGIKVVQCDIV